MKKITLRKTLIAMLAAAMCVTGAVIPTSARYVQECNHNYTHVSHGSTVDHGSDATYCYNIDYYQCVYRCNKCNNSIMGNHSASQKHDFVLQYEAHNTYLECVYCGYRK